jgi:very-short-patch-repair endonuclease
LDADARLLRIAAEHHSVFSRAQALQVGLSRRAIDGRISRGLWTPLHRGVYVPTGVNVGPMQRIMGACLACGTDAVASHDSAGFVWEFVAECDVPHVTVRAGRHRGRPGVIVHQRNSLWVVSREGLRVTTPMLTLLDLASIYTEERLERIVDDAHRRGLISPARVGEFLSLPTNRNRPGAGVLRELVAMRNGDRAIGSHLETLLLRALRSRGLPLPIPQHPVQTRNGVRYLDFAYPDAMIAIELDGLEAHTGRRALESDRARQNDLEELGWSFRRFLWTQVRADPTGVATIIGTALGLVPVRWGKPVAVRTRRQSAAGR